MISLELPADPRWLQTVRAVALHAASDLDLDSDRLDDLVLLIAEAMTGLLELHDGSRLEFRLECVDGHMDIGISSFPSEMPLAEAEWNRSLSGLITTALADEIRVEASNGHTTIRFKFPKRQH